LQSIFAQIFQRQKMK